MALDFWLSERALEREAIKQVKVDDFDPAVAPYWREQLARVDRAEALRLVHQLGGDNLFGWLRSKSSPTPSGLFAEAMKWKAATPNLVLLVQVGDFFEAWGVDAVMLVQWCGLNPMARSDLNSSEALFWM
ncbi:MSH1 [Symbiodinium sp. CCMP2592]|nr:MSH1 [Symbiodinium sp. CCMP2592]